MDETYYLYLVCGTNSSGKTQLTKKMIEVLKQRTLVVNPSFEMKWNCYEEIKSDEELKNFVGIKQLVPSGDFSKTNTTLYFDLLNRIYQNYNGGTLVLDDCRMFISNNVTDWVTRLLVSRRQKRLDIFAIFHSINQVPPSIVPFSTHMIIFKTNEDLKKSLAKVPEHKKKEVGETIARVNQRWIREPHYYEIIKF